MILVLGINTAHMSSYKLFKRINTMLKVTLENYQVIYVKSLGEAHEQAFKLGQRIRSVE